jgi:hypothetical protein
MKILFTIPTWNRAEQLALTLAKIINSAEDAKREIGILVSDNHSTDETSSVLSTMTDAYAFIEVIRPQAHISGMGNYRFILEQALARTSECDYIWSFGDDDDVSIDGLFKVCCVIESESPYFVSVGNIRLSPHTNKNYAGTVRDLALNFGFFLVFGFISQLIFSRQLIEDIISNNLMNGRFLHDSYSHGSSIIFIGSHKLGIYIDSPVSSYREVNNSEVETRKRWESEKVFDGIFGFTNSLKILTQDGILPKKLSRTFFRYWKWQFWDFLLYNASLAAMADRKELNSKYWDSIYELTNYLEDAELAKRICINVDLQRMLIASSNDNDFIALSLNKYEGLHVYKSFLGER